MLGFYWTSPESHGQGLYGRLLAHSIAVCEQRNRIPLIIMASLKNNASQRGIEKAGFAKLGVFRCARSFFDILTSHRILEQHQSLEELL